MIMHKRKDAVAPLAMAPAVGGKQFLNRVFEVAFAAGLDCALVNENRQHRIVRHCPIVLEYEREGFRHGELETAMCPDQFPASSRASAISAFTRVFDALWREARDPCSAAYRQTAEYGSPLSRGRQIFTIRGTITYAILRLA